MSDAKLFIAALILLLAVGLVTWAGHTMARVEAQLRAFSGFEDRHVEHEAQASENIERARWPTPG